MERETVQIFIKKIDDLKELLYQIETERDGITTFKQILQREKNALQIKVYELESNIEDITDRWKNDMKKAKNNLQKVTFDFEDQIEQLKKESIELHDIFA